ncbi:hypothetical protein PQX77_021558 [Marasmius sp. AFHP31]|nr:hypothetical protein PQX77_021558 [Marasmius sp. AFHP31]
MHFNNFTLLSLLTLATGIANAAKIGDHCDPAQIAATYAEICGPRESGAGSAIWKCDNNKWIIKEDCGSRPCHNQDFPNNSAYCVG